MRHGYGYRQAQGIDISGAVDSFLDAYNDALDRRIKNKELERAAEIERRKMELFEEESNMARRKEATMNEFMRGYFGLPESGAIAGVSALPSQRGVVNLPGTRGMTNAPSASLDYTPAVRGFNPNALGQVTDPSSMVPVVGAGMGTTAVKVPKQEKGGQNEALANAPLKEARSMGQSAAEMGRKAGQQKRFQTQFSSLMKDFDKVEESLTRKTREMQAFKDKDEAMKAAGIIDADPARQLDRKLEGKKLLSEFNELKQDRDALQEAILGMAGGEENIRLLKALFDPSTPLATKFQIRQALMSGQGEGSPGTGGAQEGEQMPFDPFRPPSANMMRMLRW